MQLSPAKRSFAGKSRLANDVLELKHDEPPACPRPRRPGAAAPEFLYPLRCDSHSGHRGSSEILDMISQKNDEGRECTSTGCAPACYCGSPPSRSDNPLVHDAQFVQQVELLNPCIRTKLSERVGFGYNSPI